MGDNMGPPGQEPKIKTEPSEDADAEPSLGGNVISLISDDEEDAANLTRDSPLSRNERREQKQFNLGPSVLQSAASRSTHSTLGAVKAKIRDKQRENAKQKRDPDTIESQNSAPLKAQTPGFAPSIRSGLFITDDDSQNEDLALSVLEEPTRKRKTTETSKAKKRRRPNDADEEEEDDILDRLRQMSETNPKANKGGKKRQPKTNTKKYTGPTMLNAEGINNTNIIDDAAYNDGLAAPPTFDASTRRPDALKQLMDSIPTENMAIAKTDLKFFTEKLKAFTGRVKPAEDGNWKIRGLRVTLKPYQVLGGYQNMADIENELDIDNCIGVASMRERETSSILPRGGILADQMGLGKTIMMLANVVNGRPLQQKKCRTTLIVATAALCGQWYQEIKDKVVTDKEDKIHGIGTIYHYKSISADPNDDVALLKAAEIVLTTYTIVSRSYPSVEIPAELTTAEAKDAWWKRYYEDNKGPLHRIKFHRTILDEAQAIKNHKSLTSRACRAIEAQHPWAVSGTIVMNHTNEFYPQFRFLKVPHTDSFKLFKENYNASEDPDGIKKLSARLSQFMIRRTHRDKLFNSKLLVLPKPQHDTTWLEFNDIERSIYDIVKNRFIERINCISRANELDKQYNMIWSMLLRLRQLCAHPFLVQGTISDLLHRDDYERLRALSAGDLSDESESLLSYLQHHMAGRSETKQKPSADDDTILTESEVLPVGQINFDGLPGSDLGGSHGLNYRFHRYLDDLKRSESYAAMCDRTSCVACRQAPRDPLVTSCFHIYCKDCLADLQSSSARRGNDRHRCSECGTHYTDAKPCEETLTPFAPGHEASSSFETGVGNKAVADKKSPPSWCQMRGDILPSAKTIAFKARVMTWLAEDSEAKIVVYSQFLDMIHILSRICRTEGWKAERYTGSMSHETRQRALQRFSDKDGGIKILLASLKAGGIGLNLTSANKVITIDPWWNASIENQAFYRVYRIGQVKETHLSRLVVKNTIDEAIMALQESKQIDIDAAMEESRKTSKLNPEELLGLFGKVTKDDKGRPFVFAHHGDDEGQEAQRLQPAPEHSSDEEGDGIMNDD